MPLISQFVDMVNERKIRDNPSQAGGWLIALGMDEYGVSLPVSPPVSPDGESSFGWKVGAIEPTVSEHDDIDYRYTITLDDTSDGTVRKATVLCEEVSGGWDVQPKDYVEVDVSEFLTASVQALE